ncbi:MAG: TonB-dependent receptor [Cyclobacteriaceae bacterium]
MKFYPALLAVWSTCFLAFYVHGQPSDSNPIRTVSGVVTDASGYILPFASVGVESTNQGTNTNAEGRFSLSLPEGEHILIISYVGYQGKKMTINVSDEPLELDIDLQADAAQLDDVVVYGQLTRGQAKALNIQKLSPNIVNVVDVEQFSRYPDVSAAETVQRLPGISITRDQGEGEFVQIRGVPEQFNSLTINGQRMPSMEPDAGRAVGLDLVQSYLIQTITVSKAPTPDMEADAIGGMIDFKLREANRDEELELYAGYGLNQQASEYETFGRDILSFYGVGGKRFLNDKLGVLVAGSYFDTDRGSLFNSRRFTDIEENVLRRRRTTDYDVNRERYGLVGNIDYRLNSTNKWTLTTNYNRYTDDEIRLQARYTWDNEREERRTRNRIEDQELIFTMLKGEHQFNRIKLDYSASYSVGEEDLPDRTEWRYRRDNPVLATLDRAGQDALSANTTFGLDTPLEFNRVEFEPRFTEESNTTAALDLEFPVARDDFSTFKVGAKYRLLDRSFREGGFRPEPLEGAEIPTVPEGQFPFPELRFTDAAFADLGFDLLPSDINLNEEMEGYSASEQVFASYLMNTTHWTDKLTSVAGVRIENTQTDYTRTDNDLQGEGSYTNILPSAHLTYRFTEQSQLRAAFSTALSRPNYTSLVPFETIGEDEINRGNEDLEAITATNLDLMYERYTSNVGFFSFGLFAKFIENQIITEQVGTEDEFPIISPVNGASAQVFGFEVAINQSLASLNLPLTVNANYTFTHSEADFGDDRDDLPLANSPQHIGNLSLLYDNEENGLFAVIGGVYRHFIFNKFEDTSDAQEGNEEIWLDRTFHLDMSLGYRFNDALTLKLQLNNLTNQANTEVSGKPSESFSRWTETESYGMWGVLGIEVKL